MSTENTTKLFSDQAISISNGSQSPSTSTSNTKKTDGSKMVTRANGAESKKTIDDKSVNETIVNALNAVVANNVAKNNANDNTKNDKTEAVVDTGAEVVTKTDDSTVVTKTHTDFDTTDNQADDGVKQVNIVISGFNYIINCPADERDGLNKAVGYINGFIRELRKNAPALPHENLLVLCCLNLFEEMQQQKNNTASLMETDKQVRSLLEKISSDAESIMV